MLRRLETMVLMTGYELPLRAIREQIASAVDLIVHTARLKDGSAQDRQHHRGLRDRGRRDPDPGHLRLRADRRRRRQGPGPAQADGDPADVHGRVQGVRDRAAPRRIRHPGRRYPAARPGPFGKGRWTDGDTSKPAEVTRLTIGQGARSRPAGWSTSPRWGRSIRLTGRSSTGRSRNRPASACAT